MAAYMAAVSRPGTTPPIRSRPTETSAIQPKMTSMIEGGISAPSVPPAAAAAAARPGL